VAGAAASPFTAVADGVRVRLKVTPRAAADRVGGLQAEADGGVALKVAVTAVAEDGRANRAVIDLLAKSWRLPKRSLTILQGAADRRKVLQVAGDPAELLPRLAAALSKI
jgi:uncharacterized protein (TIGR00251 family)